MPRASEAAAEAVAPDEPDAAIQRAGVHARAYSVATAPDTAPGPDAQDGAEDAPKRLPGERAAAATVQAASRSAAAAKGHAAAVKSGALVTGRMPSLSQARERHVAAAGHYDAAVLAWGRHAWGHFHLLVKVLLNCIEWVTETPPRFFLAVALLAAAWLWI
jgi:hypothetical protein